MFILYYLYSNITEALGKPTYELIKEDKSDEKTDT